MLYFYSNYYYCYYYYLMRKTSVSHSIVPESGTNFDQYLVRALQFILATNEFLPILGEGTAVYLRHERVLTNTW